MAETSSRDTRLHTVDLGGNDTVDVMIHEPQFAHAGICLGVQRDSESASVRLSASAARATAHLLLVAAEEVERRNALRKRKEVA